MGNNKRNTMRFTVSLALFASAFAVKMHDSEQPHPDEWVGSDIDGWLTSVDDAMKNGGPPHGTMGGGSGGHGSDEHDDGHDDGHDDDDDHDCGSDCDSVSDDEENKMCDTEDGCAGHRVKTDWLTHMSDGAWRV